MPTLITTDEAVAILGLSKRGFEKWQKQEYFATYQGPAGTRAVRFDKDEIEGLFRARNPVKKISLANPETKIAELKDGRKVVFPSGLEVGAQVHWEEILSGQAEKVPAGEYELKYGDKKFIVVTPGIIAEIIESDVAANARDQKMKKEFARMKLSMSRNKINVDHGLKNK